MSTELPTVTIASSDKLLQKFVESDPESPYYESDQWTVSDPVPGVRIINTWQIYPNIWLTLTATEDGQYNIYRSMGIQSPVLVHAHDCEIYNIFYVDDGVALFSAEDGWWASVNTGAEWVALWHGMSFPKANALAKVDLGGIGTWALLAYAEDHKIYYCEYSAAGFPTGTVPEFDSWGDVPITSAEPDSDIVVPEYEYWADVPAFADISTGIEWLEVYSCDDGGAPPTEKWYPAIAGGPAGVLAGAGGKLLRTTDLGSSWQVVQEISGTIKSIVISNQSRLPTFLITVESLTGESDNLFWTYDLGDSLVPELSRVGSIASVQSVTPTGTNEQQTSFIVLGKRTADGQQSYKIIGGGA